MHFMTSFIFYSFLFESLLPYVQCFDLLDSAFILTSQIIIVLSVAQQREFIILSDWLL